MQERAAPRQIVTEDEKEPKTAGEVAAVLFERAGDQADWSLFADQAAMSELKVMRQKHLAGYHREMLLPPEQIAPRKNRGRRFAAPRNVENMAPPLPLGAPCCCPEPHIDTHSI